MSKLPFIQTMIYGFCTTILALCFIIFPKYAFEASVNGMTVWWEVVFPSLLPFFILSEFLIRFGAVSFAGTLLEPLMRPLFKVPGSGGVVWAMGLASGFPAGAKLTTRLWQEGHLTNIEGERLVSFTNASNPLFIFGAVAVGFFANPELGLLLAVSHYAGNLGVGIIMRFHGYKTDKTHRRHSEAFSLKKAIKNMHKDRLKNQIPLGKMMGEAINSSIQTLLMIGGFMIFFAVLNQMLEIINVSMIISMIISIILGWFQIPKELSPGIIAGLFEITIGSQRISSVQDASLLQQAVVVSFILAFNGFSVQAQVASIIAETDIRFTPFFIARCIHGTLSAIFAYFLFHYLYTNRSIPSSDFGPSLPTFFESVSSFFLETYEIINLYGSTFTLLCLLIWFWILFLTAQER
ncbi:sporulation integral membrane protein YlbJ [Salipaludibacillus neizhouensis]|uniref:Sporulation integral membrane protein YlbJ n=1 Tax=Salipaludibacillus neizhouensis TaxID=885475 RepID=A0A3A9KEB3_9BACI|nr:sporulation integral membrane protein YlbJ [Salipaludibacillus neizhouensis]RKL68892.1 sporulation integral membrane protein YlbJ [Salipaludibacillus neizhouensis]